MKESKEDKRYRKFHSPTPRHKFRNALFILTLYGYHLIKIDKVWSNRKNIYKVLREHGAEWHVFRWTVGYHAGWVLTNKR